MPFGRLRLTIAPTLAGASRAGEALRALLDRCYGPDSPCHGIEVAAVELLANIALHGRRCSRVELRVTCGPRCVHLLAADDGVAVDMTRFPARLPADPLASGGRGLWLIARTTHSFRYRRARPLNAHRLVCRMQAGITKGA